MYTTQNFQGAPAPGAPTLPTPLIWLVTRLIHALVSHYAILMPTICDHPWQNQPYCAQNRF